MIPTLRSLTAAAASVFALTLLTAQPAVGDYPDQDGARADKQAFRAYNPWRSRPGISTDRHRSYPAYYSRPYYYPANAYRGYPNRRHPNIRYGQGEYGRRRPRVYSVYDSLDR